MAANSFKQMSRDGTIKRTDTGMFISLEHIHVREGFNKREDDERTRQADDDLFNYLMNGGTVPPLEVIARDEGGVWVVEGHRRRRCYARCAEAGKPVDRIHIMPFNGNDVQRLARIMTSNNQLPFPILNRRLLFRSFITLSTRPPARLQNWSINPWPLLRSCYSSAQRTMTFSRKLNPAPFPLMLPLTEFASLANRQVKFSSTIKQ